MEADVQCDSELKSDSIESVSNLETKYIEKWDYTKYFLDRNIPSEEYEFSFLYNKYPEKFKERKLLVNFLLYINMKCYHNNWADIRSSIVNNSVFDNSIKYIPQTNIGPLIKSMDIKNEIQPLNGIISTNKEISNKIEPPNLNELKSCESVDSLDESEITNSAKTNSSMSVNDSEDKDSVTESINSRKFIPPRKKLNFLKSALSKSNQIPSMSDSSISTPHINNVGVSNNQPSKVTDNKVSRPTSLLRPNVNKLERPKSVFVSDKITDNSNFVKPQSKLQAPKYTPRNNNNNSNNNNNNIKSQIRKPNSLSRKMSNLSKIEPIQSPMDPQMSIQVNNKTSYNNDENTIVDSDNNPLNKTYDADDFEVLKSTANSDNKHLSDDATDGNITPTVELSEQENQFQRKTKYTSKGLPTTLRAIPQPSTIPSRINKLSTLTRANSARLSQPNTMIRTNSTRLAQPNSNLRTNNNNNRLVPPKMYSKK